MRVPDASPKACTDSVSGHWVNKDVSSWAKDYFEEKLVGIKAEKDNVSVGITKVLNMEGDVDVSQRKGKVITIFDVQLQLEYSGKVGEEEVEGKISIPEVAHDTEQDEYQFEITNYADANSKQPVRDLIRSDIVPQIRKLLGGFSKDLVDHHAKDIQHAAGTPLAVPSSQITSSSSKQTTATAKPSASTSTTSKAAVVNTVTLKESYEFQTSADQLYTTFTDGQRVAAFTRAPPQVFEPKEGGAFKLFGGNVEGTFVTLEKDKRIVQKWRLSNWPAGHFSTMNLVFDQGTSETNIRLEWEGVPIGQEEVSKKNFEEYYIKSIKTTFGWVNRSSLSSTVNVKREGFTVGLWLWTLLIIPVIAGAAFWVASSQ